MNRIGEQEVFVTAHYDRAGRLLALERWDRGIDPESEEGERRRVGKALFDSRITCSREREVGNRMELIERWEYDGLIDLSRPGRAAGIKKGQNLGDYRPFSKLPKPR